MLMIELVALENGAHNNQTYTGTLPTGWAVIPDSMPPLMHNFPFGEPKAKKVNGLMTVISWTPGEMPEVEEDITIEEQIAILKAELESTDYKIIKCSEAQLVGEELPYDIVALHAERQAIRDKINELEGSEE